MTAKIFLRIALPKLLRHFSLPICKAKTVNILSPEVLNYHGTNQADFENELCKIAAKELAKIGAGHCGQLPKSLPLLKEFRYRVAESAPKT